MKRVIKFRAWNGEEISHSDECNSLEHFFACYSDGFGGYQPAIMQFSGLHDINGVEIYEGDIVETVDGGGLSAVEQKNGCWVFESCEILFQYANQIEVIGNIYQNPELLGGAK